MNSKTIIAERLIRQQIAATAFTTATELVDYLGAMQSQEYAMAKWAIGLRIPVTTDASIEHLYNEGLILRTHMLRPTWHFVSPKNIRWMLNLTAPRVNAFNAYMYRQMELDEASFRRAHKLLSKALAGKNFLNRTALMDIFEKNKLPAKGIRLGCILMEAELAGLICSGPRQGKQFTYALLEERVAAYPVPDRETALAELSRMYFTSRGPATAHDFAWWSGLSVTEARAGVSLLGQQASSVKLDGNDYFFTEPMQSENADLSLLKKNGKQTSFLLPDYDEYGISYKDRSACFDAALLAAGKKLQGNESAHMFMVDGIAAGSWKPVVKGKNWEVKLTPFRKLNRKEAAAVALSVKRYIGFFENKPAVKTRQKGLKIS